MNLIGQRAQVSSKIASGRVDVDPNEDDLNILASAGQIEPNVVRDADSTSYVLVASIPPAVLVAVDALPSSFSFVEIGGYPCLAWLDWLRCKE